MEENKKNKRKSIAEWIAVFLCIAAAPVPCITLMSATKVLSERWECIALWPALLCLVIGAIAFLITCRMLSWLIYLYYKIKRRTVMRGCLTTIITLIILFAFGGTALAAIVILVPLLLGEQDAKGLTDLHWYTWATIIILPIILLKLLVKMSRVTSNYICDMLGID